MERKSRLYEQKFRSPNEQEREAENALLTILAATVSLVALERGLPPKAVIHSVLLEKGIDSASLEKKLLSRIESDKGDGHRG